MLEVGLVEARALRGADLDPGAEALLGHRHLDTLNLGSSSASSGSDFISVRETSIIDARFNPQRRSSSPPFAAE